MEGKQNINGGSIEIRAEKFARDLDKLDNSSVRHASNDILSELTPTQIGIVIRDLFLSEKSQIKTEQTIRDGKNIFIAKEAVPGVSHKNIQHLLNGEIFLYKKHYQILSELFPELKDKLVEKYREKLESKQKDEEN